MTFRDDELQLGDVQILLYVKGGSITPPYYFSWVITGVSYTNDFMEPHMKNSTGLNRDIVAHIHILM